MVLTSATESPSVQVGKRRICKLPLNCVRYDEPDLLIFVRMDTGVVIEANFGYDQTIRDNVRFDSLLFVLSKLSMHTFCSYNCVLVI